MKNFIKCGIAGWCIEVIFTGITSYINKDKNVLLRGSYYTLYIFFGEFITGSFLKRFNQA